MKRQRGGVKRRLGHGQDQGRRKDNDPLQTFEAAELGADGSNRAAEGGRVGDAEGQGGGAGFGEETTQEAAKRMNEERKSRVMQASIMKDKHELCSVRLVVFGDVTHPRILMKRSGYVWIKYSGAKKL